MSERPIRRGVAFALAVLTATAVTATAAAPASTCTAAQQGGQWSTYGQSLMGQQRQDAERTIGVGNVDQLTPIWTSAGGAAQSAPVMIVGGCVFVNMNGGIEALDLRTGVRKWRFDALSTSGTYAVGVYDGRVHGTSNVGGKPVAFALSQRTGQLLWKSDPIYFGHQANQLSSPIVFDNIRILFTTGPDNDVEAKQGYALLDARTGRILVKRMTLPPSDQKKGLVGGGAWGTPTVDPVSGYAFVGTSNPESKTGESNYDDAILKIDMDRHRKTFGRIVATLKGTPDSVTGYDNPVCQTVGGTLWVNLGTYGASPTCGQLDMDFGIGPTLWRDPSTGRLMGAATQKSGYLHVFFADTMRIAYRKQLFVTLSFVGGNLCRIATDGKTLWLVANPGVVYALDAKTGATKWMQPLPGGQTPKGGNIALVNGVAFYTDDLRGIAFNAATGEELWSSAPVVGNSVASSTSVGGHYVVMNHAGVLKAYRLGG